MRAAATELWRMSAMELAGAIRSGQAPSREGARDERVTRRAGDEGRGPGTAPD